MFLAGDDQGQPYVTALVSGNQHVEPLIPDIYPAKEQDMLAAPERLPTQLR